MKKRIAVIGGGLAGTAAAYKLVARGYDVTIIERDACLGGRVHSIPSDGLTLEMGAGFITNSYDNLLTFVQDTGLGNQLYRQHGHSGIMRDGEIMLLTPRTILSDAALSWSAKAQIIPLLTSLWRNWRSIDSHEPWRAAKCDTQSAAEMLQGHGGQEFLEYVIQPILNGYFYWTPEQTSQAMLLMTSKMLGGGRYRLHGGLRQIPEQAAAGAHILLNHTVTQVRQNPNGGYRLTARQRDGRAKTMRIDGIVCATTASVVPAILADLTERQNAFFTSIKYSRSAVLAQMYHQNPDASLSSTSIAFPRRENNQVAAMTVSPETNNTSGIYAGVKIYASGTCGSKLLAKTDDGIAGILLKNTEFARKALLGENSQAMSTHLQRWPEALPVFSTGHFQKLQAFAEGTIETSRLPLVFAGDYLGGPFMEGAFTSGLQAADRLHARLQ